MSEAQPIGTNQNNLPFCPVGPNIDRAKSLVRLGTNLNLLGGGAIIGGLLVQPVGGGPENPLADIASAALIRWGGRTMAAGDIAGGIGIGYLARNGMFGEAVNTVAETILDKPFPEPMRPYADQVIDASLNGIEGSLGLSLNSCRVR